MPLDLSSQFLDIFSQMEDSSQHLFITGKAGTGKSTLLSYFRGLKKESVSSRIISFYFL